MKVFVGLLALVGAVVAAPSLGIIGGQDASPGEYPFVAAIETCQMIDFGEYYCEFSCAGVILNKHWILTSATCASSINNGAELNVGRVSLDGSDVDDMDMLSQYYYHIHPDYKGGVSANDIALLQVRGDGISFNDLVQPAKGPAQGTEPSGDAVVLGWGSQGGNRNSNNLRKAHVSILSQTGFDDTGWGNSASGSDCSSSAIAFDSCQCQSALKKLDEKYQNAYDTASNICAGPLSGVNSTCNLDTGGALVQNGQVVGIVSWTVSPCSQPGVPSVFTKTSNYIKWINDVILNK